MKNLKQKLIYFLSDPSISDKDLDQLIHWLKTGNIEEITSAVKKIRNTIKMIGDSTDDSSHNRALDDNYSSENSRTMEVERLLIEEANLTREEAKNLLAGRFNLSLNPNQRIAFNKWIEKLGEKVGWSELLHVAHLIRNDRVQGNPDNPWPLQQND